MKTVHSFLAIAIACAIAAPVSSVYAQNTSAADSSAVSQQAGSLTGRVINNATGSLLQAASVRVVELNREVTTGRDGSFVLTNVPAGNYTLEVNYGGLDSQQLPVVVTAGGSVRQDIRLSNQSHNVEQM